MKHKCDVFVIIRIHVANCQESNILHGTAIEWASVALMHKIDAIFFRRHIL